MTREALPDDEVGEVLVGDASDPLEDVVELDEEELGEVL